MPFVERQSRRNGGGSQAHVFRLLSGTQYLLRCECRVAFLGTECQLTRLPNTAGILAERSAFQHASR
jgi:hypothetical protein